MLYRLLIVSEMVGTTGRTPLSVASILGVAEYNNRRDRIGNVILFHDGEAAQMLEGARVDLDRLMARQAGDGRHVRQRVVAQRPIAHRTLAEPVRLNVLNAETARRSLGGRRLSELAAVELEALLSSDALRASRAA